MQQLRPIFRVVNRYENACSYSKLFQSLDRIAILLNIPYSVVVLSADICHLGCKKAMEDIFPNLNADSTSILHTACWLHNRRNILIKNRAKCKTSIFLVENCIKFLKFSF